MAEFGSSFHFLTTYLPKTKLSQSKAFVNYFQDQFKNLIKLRAY